MVCKHLFTYDTYVYTYIYHLIMFAFLLGLKWIVNLLFGYPDVKLLHEYPMDSENIRLVLLTIIYLKFIATSSVKCSMYVT